MASGVIYHGGERTLVRFRRSVHFPRCMRLEMPGYGTVVATSHQVSTTRLLHSVYIVSQRPKRHYNAVTTLKTKTLKRPQTHTEHQKQSPTKTPEMQQLRTGHARASLPRALPPLSSNESSLVFRNEVLGVSGRPELKDRE